MNAVMIVETLETRWKFQYPSREAAREAAVDAAKDGIWAETDDTRETFIPPQAIVLATVEQPEDDDDGA
jgi:hypothetical protein